MILCSQNWYLKTSIPLHAETLAGEYPPITGTAQQYQFKLAANNTYVERQVTLVFSTADNTTEYEEIITQKGNIPELTFDDSGTSTVEVHFTDNGPATKTIPFKYNFAWRMVAGAGFNNIVNSTNPQIGVTFPCTNIAAGESETLIITPYDYTNQNDIPQSGTILTTTIEFYNYSTDPYPTGQIGQIDIKRTIQPVFNLINVTSSAGTGIIPQTGGTLSVTAGSNAAWGIITSDNLSDNTPAGNYTVTTLQVTVPPNLEFVNTLGNTKEIELSYVFEGMTIPLGKFQQEAFNISFSRSSKFLSPLYGTEIDLFLNVQGSYPDILIKAQDENGVDASDIHNLPAGTADEISIRIYENPYNIKRQISIYYSIDAGGTWHQANYSGPRRQYRGGFYTSDIRNSNFPYSGYLSLTNVKVNGTPGADPMTWAEAMGIETSYNNSTFYNRYTNLNRENPDYEPTEQTGCGAYGETDYTTGWRLPTSTEVKEILKAQIEGTYDFQILDGQKFHTSYDGGLGSTRIVWIENGEIKESQNNNKSEAAYVRCVYRLEDDDY